MEPQFGQLVEKQLGHLRFFHVFEIIQPLRSPYVSLHNNLHKTAYSIVVYVLHRKRKVYQLEQWELVLSNCLLIDTLFPNWREKYVYINL